ncbi:MAG TPA: class I SAM-dependent methyltransferase [Vicinamibacterales bacterium]|nr:class I SAM-dependent methyltransferase [Vicinamibacterales bacterium]
MLFLLRMLTRHKGVRSMDPLQVSMTGVRMGERFLLIGCHDRALLSGLASKVGLSGGAAVAGFDDAQVKRAHAVGSKIGALIETHKVDARTLPFDSDQFDMVVVDDTSAAFAGLDADTRIACLSEARRAVRRGGRIEVVEGATKRSAGYDVQRDLATVGFTPVRLLAERDGFRFIEGLKTA